MPNFFNSVLSTHQASAQHEMMLAQVQEIHFGTAINGCLDDLPCDTGDVECAQASTTDWTDFTDCLGVINRDLPFIAQVVMDAFFAGGEISGLEPCNQTVDIDPYDCNWFRRLGDATGTVPQQDISCDPSIDLQGNQCSWYFYDDDTLEQCGSHDSECFLAVRDCPDCTAWSEALCDSTVDAHNSTCSYYGTHYASCGDHDTDCFHAFEDCDQCTCDPDLDDMGDDCAWYEGNVGQCGLQDTPCFFAASQCDACMTMTCNPTVDSFGEPCDAYELNGRWNCGLRDTDCFSSMTQCNACMDIPDGEFCASTDLDSRGLGCGAYEATQCGSFDTRCFAASECDVCQTSQEKSY